MRGRPMKRVLIGKYAIPLWVLGVALAGICIGSFAMYMVLTFIIPFEVKEPIEVLYYPSQLSLYPGETIYFNITVRNRSSQNYTVFLDFSLDNSTYETSYVTFSNATYFVRPGVQNLTAWIIVSADAPSKNATLTVNLFREASQDSGAENIVITSIEFSDSGTTIKVTVNNTGTIPVTISQVQINDVKKTTNPPLPQTVAVKNELTLNIISQWVPGNTYQVKLISLMGNQFIYVAVAPSGFAPEESLHMTKQHVWYNATGSWAEAAVVIINTGTLNIILDKISVRGQECPWTNVYYWKTNNTTISNDLQVTSTPLTGDTFNITVQGLERVFQRATGDLTLEVGWTIVVYIINPDSITLNDVGVTVGITVFTANAQYYKETNVEPVQDEIFLYKANVRFYDDSGVKKIDLDIGNSGTANTQIIQVYMGTSASNLENQTTIPALPVPLAAGSIVRITIIYTWTQGTIYYFKVETSTTQSLLFIEIAPSA
jgi:urease beta subunit